MLLFLRKQVVGRETLSVSVRILLQDQMMMCHCHGVECIQGARIQNRDAQGNFSPSRLELGWGTFGQGDSEHGKSRDQRSHLAAWHQRS